MLTINWCDLTPERFLAEYWQKKPLLLKGGFAGFQDTISADELAGLAMEEEIESRIIAHSNFKEWQVEHGPFDDYNRFGEQGWTLLVQAVNNWSTETQDILSAFDFVPRWRLDDVMVSFSTPEGGVGAHLDQYDVFIIQGEGKRRWQVGLPDDSLETLVPHPDLKQVSPFTPCIDVVTESGDILYIPPNHPHNGVSIENSLNFSVGFQAPNSQEMISTFADICIDKCLGETRFGDKDRSKTTAIAELAVNDIDKLHHFMLEQLSDKALFSEMIGKFLTRSHHTLELLIPVEPFTEEAVIDFIEQEDIYFRPVLGIKALINKQNNLLYINGEEFEINEDTQSLSELIAAGQSLTTNNLKSFVDCLKNAQLLTTILNMGYWYID